MIFDLSGVRAGNGYPFDLHEFTLTFARIDHEVEEGDVPGVVVSRVNMSQQFAGELLAALQEAYSKYTTVKGIQDLPETDDRQKPSQLGLWAIGGIIEQVLKSSGQFEKDAQQLSVTARSTAEMSGQSANASRQASEHVRTAAAASIGNRHGSTPRRRNAQRSLGVSS